MDLNDWQGLDEKVKAGSHKVDIEKAMISHDTIDSFVVANSVFGVKLHYHFLK